jgi:hypothetical protein
MNPQFRTKSNEINYFCSGPKGDSCTAGSNASGLRNLSHWLGGPFDVPDLADLTPVQHKTTNMEQRADPPSFSGNPCLLYHRCHLRMSCAMNSASRSGVPPSTVNPDDGGRLSSGIPAHLQPVALIPKRRSDLSGKPRGRAPLTPYSSRSWGSAWGIAGRAPRGTAAVL